MRFSLGSFERLALSYFILRTTTTVSWPLYRSACFSRLTHVDLYNGRKTDGLCIILTVVRMSSCLLIMARNCQHTVTKDIYSDLLVRRQLRFDSMGCTHLQWPTEGQHQVDGGVWYLKLPCWHCSHSMRSRIYPSVGYPSICLSVCPSIGCSIILWLAAWRSG